MNPKKPHSSPAEICAVIPAGGVGARVGGQVPKQYLPLVGEKTMLECTVSVLLQAAWINPVVVVVAPDDGWHEGALTGLSLLYGARLQVCKKGGATRRDSVLAGLRHLSEGPQVAGSPLGLNAWVMVHDAARPGLDQASLSRLRDAVLNEAEAATGKASGGILGLPVADTIKSLVAGGFALRSHCTLDRTRMWAAQTPQMFGLGALRSALEQFENVTDEASAMEQAGVQPLLVEGSSRNFKVTTTDDLYMMRSLLQLRRDDDPPMAHGKPELPDRLTQTPPDLARPT